MGSSKTVRAEWDCEAEITIPYQRIQPKKIVKMEEKLPKTMTW